MRRTLISALFSISIIGISLGQTEFEKVESVVKDFLKGTSNNMPDLIESTFYEKATLYLTNRDGNIQLFTPKEYIGFFDKGESEYGKPNGRVGNLISIEIENDLATVTADALFPKGEYRYVDKYILRRFDNGWKIMAKASTRYKLER